MSMNGASDLPVARERPEIVARERPEIVARERPEIKVTEKPKRKYTHTKPNSRAKVHDVGHREKDAKGRIHEVVVVPAFDSVRKAWKIIPYLSNDSLPSNVESKKVSFSPLVDYSDSEDEDQEPSTLEMNYQSDGEQKTKRKYNSSKPKIDPRDHGEGKVIESEGKMWVVAEVKTRGDGRRLLWKILKSDVGHHSEPEQMDRSVAANILLGLSSAKVIEVEVEKMEVEKMEVEKMEVEKMEVKPKKARPGPEVSAAQFDVGVELVGKDGQTKFKCVERTRKGKDGTEPKTYKMWQKMKAQ